jgi:signal transduction histidine kinase
VPLSPSLILHPDAAARDRLAALLAKLGAESMARTELAALPALDDGPLALVGGEHAAEWIRALRGGEGGDALHIVLVEASGAITAPDDPLALGADDVLELDGDDGAVTRRLSIALRQAARRGSPSGRVGEGSLTSRKRMLDHVATALTAMLGRSTEGAIDRVLHDIGEAAGAEHVYVAEHRPNADGETEVAVVHAWRRDPSLPWSNGTYRTTPVLHERIERGEAIFLRASKMIGDARALLEGYGVKSLLVVPVFLEGRCWGQIGLCDLVEERSWGEDAPATLAATAASIGAVLAHNATLRALYEANAQMAEQTERIRSLYDAVSNPTLPLRAQLDRVLATGCRLLASDVASVTRIGPDDRDACTIEYAYPESPGSAPGTRVPLLREAWEASIRSGEPLAVADTGAALDEHADAPSHLVRSFLGSVVWVRGEPYGALNFISERARQGGYKETDLDLARLVARWVGLLIERMRDDEQRRRLEARFREAQKLESLGLLAGGVAHDFNNLLMIILGHASLALRDLPVTSPARDAVEQVALAAKRSAELTRQMLAFAGREPRRDSILSLAQAASETLKLLGGTVPDGVRLQSEIEEIPAVYADPAQIRRVLMNLVTNAAEAIGDRVGTVVVRTGIEEAGPSGLRGIVGTEDAAPGRYAFVEVEDDGCGIGPGTLARIFDPFFSTKFTGRGLGLATTLGIVRSHRGAIRVTSDPGRRTTFRVLLPISQGVADGRALLDTPVAPPARVLGRVLVVDDDDAVRSTVTTILARNGLEVVAAASGAEAIAIVSARAAELDLVLLDVTMPGMDGATTLRALREIRSDVPVVLMSGYTEGLAGRLEGEPVDFIQKPFSANELLARIAPALRPA